MALVDNDLISEEQALNAGTLRAESKKQLSGTLKAHASADTELPLLTVLVADGATLRPFAVADAVTTIRGFVWPNPIIQYVGGENVLGFMAEGNVDYRDIPDIDDASAKSIALLAALELPELRKLNIIIEGGLPRQ